MPAEFRMTRRIAFAETDMAGVMHFSNYFRLMEEAEHAFWRSLDLTVFFRDREPNLSWPRVAVHCEYHAPLRFEDEVELHLTVVKVGSKSLEYKVEFLRDGAKCAVGKTTAVCCITGAHGAFSATTIPDDIRRKLAG